MKVLILGGQGNLGTQLGKVFAPDFETISWDRGDIDVLDFPLLNKKINDLAPELIINAVAYNAVDKCEEKGEYEAALKLNAELPAALAEIALHLGATLIHYSSDYVFYGDKNLSTNQIIINPNCQDKPKYKTYSYSCSSSFDFSCPKKYFNKLLK